LGALSHYTSDWLVSGLKAAGPKASQAKPRRRSLSRRKRRRSRR
jgi:hypothetical protein